MEERRIPVTGGTTLHVLTWPGDGGGAGGRSGSDAPVLLVHGLASNAHLWDGVAARLAQGGHRVAAVDQRGHGLSDKPDDGYDFATVTADLVEVIRALGWQGDHTPLVVGQSWGGNVALELAVRHPDVVRGLVLVDGGTIELSARFADWPTCEVALAPPEFGGATAAELEKMMRTHHPDWPESGITGTMANMEVRPDGTIRPWLSRAHHMTILRSLWEHQPSLRYQLVAAPVLLLPAEDPASPRWMAEKREELAKASAGLGRSVIRWIAGDHDLHAQHPDLVAELIDAAAQPGFFPE